MRERSIAIMYCGVVMQSALEYEGFDKGYFRSHPVTSERLAQAERLIAAEGWRDRKSQKPFRVVYQVRNGEFVKQ